MSKETPAIRAPVVFLTIFFLLIKDLKERFVMMNACLKYLQRLVNEMFSN